MGREKKNEEAREREREREREGEFFCLVTTSVWT
jgi:hypothetical protein